MIMNSENVIHTEGPKRRSKNSGTVWILLRCGTAETAVSEGARQNTAVRSHALMAMPTAKPLPARATNC